MLKYIQFFSKMIDKHGISFLPLHSIREGKCTCGNEKCISPGKHPRIRKSWKKIASAEKAKLKEWQDKYKDTLNLGVCTGELPSGKHLVVIDVDTKSHSLMAKLPKTFNYRTGSGGHHFWFFADRSVNNSISSLAEKVDVRGKGGYVVVPPSRHLSGSVYHFHDDSHHEIADLPEWFFTDTSRKKTGSITRQGTGKQNKELAHHWSALSIPEIRERLSNNVLIPNGARNTTIHRLLSSDRAKGTLYKSEMWQKALVYRSLSEEHGTITDNELSHIVSSAMKYEPYNNYEPSKVLESYVKFMNRKEDKVNEGWVKKLDEYFFSCLKSDGKIKVPLSFLMNEYEQFFQKHGVPHPPRYKSQLFARKLQDLGFIKTRTASNNLWCISLEISSPLAHTKEKLVLLPAQEQEEREMGRNNMTPEEIDEASKNLAEWQKELSEELKAAAPVGPQRGDPDEVVQIRTESRIKLKKHPSEEKYHFFRTTYEYNKVYTEKTLSLSEDELKLLAKGQLIQDLEGTKALFDQMEELDILGLGYEKYQVVEKNDDHIVAKQLKTGDEREWTLADIDFERSLDFAEILYRLEGDKYEIFGEREKVIPIIYRLLRKDLKPGQEKNIWYPDDEEEPKQEDVSDDE